MIDVDPIGLEPADKHILRTIIEKFGGGPVGLGTIAAATSEEVKTIEDVYEPYLLQIGFLARTPADGLPPIRPTLTWVSNILKIN